MTLDLARLPEALRDHGLRVKETDGWLTRGYGPLDLAGHLSHHTAIDGPASDRLAEAMIRGRSDLSGPLANDFGGLEVDGKFTVWLLAGREAHHAGKGSSTVLREFRAGVHVEKTAADRGLTDDINGNPFLWGSEWQHVGTHPRYAEPLLEGIGRHGAAFCELTGLPPEAHKGHKHWTPRKIDPSWPGSLPDLTRRYLEDDDMTAEERALLQEAVALGKANAQAIANLDADAKNYYTLQMFGKPDPQGPDSKGHVGLRELREQIEALAASGTVIDYDRLADKVADRLAARLGNG